MIHDGLLPCFVHLDTILLKLCELHFFVAAIPIEECSPSVWTHSFRNISHVINVHNALPDVIIEFPAGVKETVGAMMTYLSQEFSSMNQNWTSGVTK